MDGVKGREVYTHTHFIYWRLSHLDPSPPPNDNWWTRPPLPLSLPRPWRLPEDGALEVAPLHRNRVCHGNQSFLPPPGPWAPEGTDSLSGS